MQSTGNRKLKIASQRKLAEAIRTALDCPSHFLSPTIINNDPQFDFGNAQVICQTCVEKLREVIELGEDDSVPTSYQMWGE